MDSKLTYPVGPADESSGQRTRVPVKCGWVSDGKRLHFRFEILYSAGTSSCPNKAKQFIRVTATCRSVEDRKPKEEKDANGAVTDPGGYDAKSWAEDNTSKGNCADGFTATDGTQNGYIDMPGFPFTDPKTGDSQLPFTYDAQFKIVVTDCHGGEVDCVTFEIHLAVDERGTVTRQDVTPIQGC